MVEVIRDLVTGSRLSEGSAGGVEEGKRASGVIMLKLEGALGSERLVTLRVESSIARHLHRF